MAKTIEQLKAQGAEVKNATVVGENTATRVGTLFTDIVEHVEQYEAEQTADTEANALVISNEAQARAKADEGLNAAIVAEKTRATAAEQANAQVIADETARAMAAEGAIIYDVSSHNDGAVFESIQTLLSSSNLSTLIPTSVRCGGMSIRFIQGSIANSDNKYVQYQCISDEFTTDITKWDVYDNGIYIENQEFVYVKKDSQGKFIFGVQKDGNIVFGYAVPEQIKDYILKQVIQLIREIDTKVSKEAGKSLINSNVASSLSYIDNPEFVDVIKDKDGRIVFAIGKDGKSFKICDITSQGIYNMLSEIEAVKINSVQPYCLMSFESGETIFSNIDAEAQSYENWYIGGSKIVKVSDSMYYLYYSAIGESQPNNTSPFIAYSTDGKHFTRSVPQGVTAPYAGTNRLCFNYGETQSYDGIGGLCVFKVKDNNYPFRLLGTDGKKELLFKSSDGVTFIQPKIVINGLMDTISSCVVRGDIIKIYGRMWNSVSPSNRDRYISVTYIDLDGNIIYPTRAFLGGTIEHDYYVSGAVAIDDRRELLFPTQQDDSTQKQELRCYLVDGEHIERLDVDFTPLYEQGDLQWYVNTIYPIGTDLYIQYNADKFKHGVIPHSAEDGYSTVRIAKIDFKTKGFIL